MSNIIKAIINIINHRQAFNGAPNGGGNMMNARGATLEGFVKDAFAGTFGAAGGNQRWVNTCFSHLGTANNPPDMILTGGDAIEVKKETGLGQLQLNSSCPINKLYHNNPKISASARTCDGGNWQSKDILYVIGTEPQAQIGPNKIWMIYGDCLSPNEQVFRTLEQDIKTAVEAIPNYNWIPTNELAKALDVDPLGTADLRVRSMWMLDHPNVLFQHCITRCIQQYGANYANPQKFRFDKTAAFQMNVLMPLSKFNSLPQVDRQNIINLRSNDLLVEDVIMADPNNPAVAMHCKLICYSI
ncbi:MAG: NgoPII family restriction endonuclease [Bacteroidales bacterium]|nr:NgoPII family restriction endonuclease [Bacteroidales bacterium]